MSRKTLPAALLLIAVILALAACSDPPPPRLSTNGFPRYFGVYEPAENASFKTVTNFGQDVGRQPNLILFYDTVGEDFPDDLANQIYQHGATPVLQISPGKASMAAVAHGRYDRWLRSYADAVHNFGHRIVVGFAAEMNADWYRWGWKHTPPAIWIAAWRHVVTTFRAQGARNVTWMWTVNRASGSTAPVRLWWPGSAYVDWVGIDGYYFLRSETFSSVFGPAIAQIRLITGAPILLSEMAVGPTAGPAAIPGVFAGIRQYQLDGLIWFDRSQQNGLYHQDWRLENNPAIMAEFRKQIKRLNR